MTVKSSAVGRNFMPTSNERADLDLLSTISLSRIPECSGIHRKLIQMGLHMSIYSQELERIRSDLVNLKWIVKPKGNLK